MTSDFTEMEQRRYFSTASRLANREPISAMEERWLRGYLDRYAPAREVEKGFPEAPSGDARGENNLRRTNWFNGRYLTAEALSRQDVYFDHRARLNAHALMPGIAWGLGIVGVELNQLSGNTLKGGCPTNAPLTLRRGLAFDGVGRPILVSHDFRFTLADLIGVALKTPRRVVGGGREFTPCVCLAPDTIEPSGGGGTLPSGPFLLVIEAGERPEGKAKVTGDVCGGRHGAPCEADVWRGGFGLSLVRFPVDVPLLDAIPDVWALRGTLSAYYFDVFEHPLWKRWDPSFPSDGGFSRDSGPGRHEGMAIPLALVHLGEDNTALYLDSWIPRRLITATPGEDWHRVRFGAPPRAAAWARIHQFQTMLEERLAQAARNQPKPGVARPGFNLFQGGFRHIPPIGFLPIWPGRPRGAGQAPAQQSRTACTTFGSLNGNTQLGKFDGDQAVFNFTTKPVFSFAPNAPIAGPLQTDNNTICLNINSYRSCSIQLNYPAQVVRLRLAVNPSVEVRLYEAGGADMGAVDLKQASNSSLRLITINQPGVAAITMRASDNDGVIYLAELCYDYNLTIAMASIPAAPASTRTELAHEALRQAEAYFAGTNVVPYGVIALHDDDILEDLHNVIDKDPLQLEPRQKPQAFNVFNDPVVVESIRRFGAISKVNLFLFALGIGLRSKGLDIDALVNRRTEVVKLVMPLQGISRNHPLLGKIPEDAARQAQGWGLAGSANLSTATMAGLLSERGVDVLPRGHVVYVKQRLVLLDLVFQMVEVLQVVVEVVLAARKPRDGFSLSDLALSNQPIQQGTVAAQPDKNVRAMQAATTADYQVAVKALRENDRQLLRASIQQPVVQEFLLQTMATTAPWLAKADRSQSFLDQVAASKRLVPEAITDPREREAWALTTVTDAWTAEYSDAQVLPLLVAVLPPEQMVDLVKQLGAIPGTAAPPTVEDGLKLTPPSPFGSDVSRELYVETRQRLETRPIRDLVPDLPRSEVLDALTVADVLARTPQEARDVLGGAANLQSVRKAFLDDRQAALEAAKDLVDGAPPAVVAKVEAAVAGGAKPDQALNQLREEETAKPEAERDNSLLRTLANAETLLRVSGNRLAVLRPLRRPPGG